VLGLHVETDPRWVDCALSDLPRLLVDHAHCEMKAASNALSLSARCLGHPAVTRALVELAEEELRHLRRVLAELERRGIPLGPPEEDWYAAELRRRVARDRGAPQPASKTGASANAETEKVLVDRLLVGALIEARSCERFKLLAVALAREEGAHGDAALARFFEELFAEEAKHHRTFFDLAVSITNDPPSVKRRLEAIAEIEAGVVADLEVAPTMHG